jgi:photosystem II stability/assembly factor-like uncharacterized protein
MKISTVSTGLLVAVVALLSHVPAQAALDQWSTGGPNGVGPINAVAVDPTDSLVLYAGSGSGGAVSKSTDGGASWQPANTGLPGSAKSSLAIDPTNHSIVYAGVNVGGVFKSTNGGGNWNPANTGLLVASVQSITIDPQNPNILSASTSGAPPNGVFRSVNGGGNWNVMGIGLPNGIINTLAIDPQSPSTIYAGTQFGVYKTTNSGGNWVPMNAGFNPPTPIINAVVINPQNPSEIFVGTGGFGVWKSVDAGVSWTQVSTGLTSSGINDLVMDPQRPHVLYAATASAGVFRTRNGGETWTSFGVGLTANTIPSLAISPSGTCLHAGTNVNGASGQVFDFAFVAGCGAPTRAANISTRGRIEVGDNVMIGGFIIDGSTPMTVLIRAVGPSLANFGVPDVLANPFVRLFSGATPIAENDDWEMSLPLCPGCGTPADIIATGLAPTDPSESTILIELPPGAYTAIVSGVGGTTGVGLVEVFEVGDHPEARLLDISTRGFVQVGDGVMIGGFILAGVAPTTVLIRGVGPSLADFGVPGPLANPVLQIFSGPGMIAENDDWETSLPLCQVSGFTCGDAAEIMATGLAPTNPLEAAILITLPPGPYTAILSGLGATTGVGLVEVLDILDGP